MPRAFDIGARVELIDLSAKPELNGTHGIVEDYHPDKDRHQVRMDGKKNRLLLASKNLVASIVPPPPTDISDAPDEDAPPRPKPSNMVKAPDPLWDENGIYHGKMTEEIMNEPTGVCRTLPGGQELMRKMIGEKSDEKTERENEQVRREQSAAAVPPIVVRASQADAAGVRELLAEGWDVDAQAPQEEGGWRALQIVARSSQQIPTDAKLETIDVLLAAGADINGRMGTRRRDPTGLTAARRLVARRCADGFPRHLSPRAWMAWQARVSPHCTWQWRA